MSPSYTLTYIHDLRLILSLTNIVLYIITHYYYKYITYSNINKLLLIFVLRLKVKILRLKKSWRFSPFIDEIIKKRVPRNFIIIDFSSLKKYNTKYCRTLPLFLWRCWPSTTDILS